MSDNTSVLTWRARPVFEPMWGDSQLGDPARLGRVIACFSSAFEDEAERLSTQSSPCWMEKAWKRGWHAWMTGVPMILVFAWALSHARTGEAVFMAGVSITAWGLTVYGLAFYLFPVVALRLDPTRPYWAKSSHPLDESFKDWTRRSLARFSEDDQAKLQALMPSNARDLHDAWKALERAQAGVE